jgi:hypothetical protein
MSEATAAVFLSADDGHGETFLLSDPAELQQRTMILSDPATGSIRCMVDREQFMAAGYSVTVDAPAPGSAKRRRFTLRGRGR